MLHCCQGASNLIMKNCSEFVKKCLNRIIIFLCDLQEQKKSFLAQLAAISNVSKSEMNEIVENAVIGRWEIN